MKHMHAATEPAPPPVRCVRVHWEERTENKRNHRDAANDKPKCATWNHTRIHMRLKRVKRRKNQRQTNICSLVRKTIHFILSHKMRLPLKLRSHSILPVYSQWVYCNISMWLGFSIRKKMRETFVHATFSFMHFSTRKMNEEAERKERIAKESKKLSKISCCYHATRMVYVADEWHDCDAVLSIHTGKHKLNVCNTTYNASYD